MAMPTIHEISAKLHEDPAYGPALTRFRSALADTVTLKSDEDKTAKPFPSFKHLHRSLEDAGIIVGYHHLQNGHMEHKIPQLEPSLLNSIAAHAEEKAKIHSPARMETLSLCINFDAAHQGDVTRAELEEIARAAIEKHLLGKSQRQAPTDGQAPAPVKP